MIHTRTRTLSNIYRMGNFENFTFTWIVYSNLELEVNCLTISKAILYRKSV